MNPQPPPPPPPQPPPQPTTPRREVQLQGPRPAPLKVSKESVKIKKPPPHPHQRPNPQLATDQYLHGYQQQQQQQQQQNQPVVIYTVSPKVIHATVTDFMSIVQRLTGPSSSPPGDLSPAARLASIQKTSPNSSSDHRDKLKHQHQHQPITTFATTTDDDDPFMAGIDLMGQFPGILSPAPATLPPIPTGFFSPAVPDPQTLSVLHHLDLSPFGFSNNSFSNFMASPSISAPLVSPSPSSWDLFNNFLDFF